MQPRPQGAFPWLCREVRLQRQGKAPWARGWGKWSFNWRWLATLSGRVQKIGIFL